jgi:hypothetical protein
MREGSPRRGSATGDGTRVETSPGYVLGFVWPGYACGDPVGDALVALNQRLERPKVTGKRPFDEGPVRVVRGAKLPGARRSHVES